ncbi:hypothetical protein BH10PSE12_BH10PSE12_06190 [soil metagenome]
MNDLIDLKEALDILNIQRLLYTSLRSTDEKDWTLFKACFADEVTIDFVGVQPAATVSIEALCAQSERNYVDLKTQHMSTNLDVRVEGNSARSTSHGRARHEYVGDGASVSSDRAIWHIYARYENDYIRTADGWKISRIMMEPLWQEGNLHLLEDAAKSKDRA